MATRRRLFDSGDSVTDFDTDRYLGTYKKDEEYPALHTALLARREDTDAIRRYSAFDEPDSGVELHDGAVKSGAGRGKSVQSEILNEREKERLQQFIEAIIADIHYCNNNSGERDDSDAIHEALLLKLFHRKSFDEIGLSLSVTKSKVTRWILKLKVSYCNYIVELAQRQDFGDDEVIRMAFARKAMDSITAVGSQRARKCLSCGGGSFGRNFRPTGHNRNIVHHVCLNPGCRRDYTASEYARLGFTSLLRRPVTQYDGYGYITASEEVVANYAGDIDIEVEGESSSEFYATRGMK